MLGAHTVRATIFLHKGRLHFRRRPRFPLDPYRAAFDDCSMEATGHLRKMKSEASRPVRYALPLDDAAIPMNDAIGAAVRLRWSGKIVCIGCGKKTKKSFNQGYCYACYLNSPENEACVLRPEECRAHEGVARDMEWARTHCLIEHVVYLALSSDVKVGVTRHTQTPTRWIDQGASAAIVLARTPNRHLAGLIETDLKRFMKDKTDWRKMLKDEVADIDLVAAKKTAAAQMNADLKRYLVNDDAIVRLEYPLPTPPQKASSLSFDKQPEIGGTLIGIKGQYLIFEGGAALNIRKHQGYEVALTIAGDAPPPSRKGR
jgi:Protein of unknown function (DUF2797)